MKRAKFAPLVLALAAAATTAQAQSYDRGYDPYDHGYGAAAISDVARVIRVEPVVERVQQPVQNEECWYEEEPVYARDERGGVPRTTGGGAVLGAIVGGALGNTVGRGDGRRAATVAGAVIGGTIGNNIERDNIRRQDEYYGRNDDRPIGSDEVRRCRVVTSYQDDERVVGYRVDYEYAGRRFQTITDSHPGSSLRVRVEVVPEN